MRKIIKGGIDNDGISCDFDSRGYLLLGSNFQMIN
jgi:hypothetical protein